MNRTEPKILVACEYSGTVTDAFIDWGYDAYSCDLLPAEGANPERHFEQDVRPLIQSPEWDLIIVAHPPCTRLCNSGVRWLSSPPNGRTLEEMWQELDEGCDLFSEFLNAPCPRIAIENPVMHKHAKQRIENYREFSQSIQPWQFGETDKKRTCLWLKGLPDLNPTKITPPELRTNRIHSMGPSKDRGKERARFFPGIADAMVQQWGALCEEQLELERMAA